MTGKLNEVCDDQGTVCVNELQCMQVLEKHFYLNRGYGHLRKVDHVGQIVEADGLLRHPERSKINPNPLQLAWNLFPIWMFKAKENYNHTNKCL